MAQKTLGHFTLVANPENILNVQQVKFGQLCKGSLQNPVFNGIYAPLDGVGNKFCCENKVIKSLENNHA